MRLGLATGCVLVCGLASIGCSTVLGLDDLVADRGGGGVGAGSATGTGQGGGCLGPCGSPGCGACPVDNVVVVTTPTGTFAIDKYEVTNAEYNAFLATNPSLSLAPQPTCSYNGSFQPGALDQATIDLVLDEGLPFEDPRPNCMAWSTDFNEPDRPAACVDWCDAAAYCAWAGKRLCGRYGGAGYDVTGGPAEGHADATVSEWFAACTGATGTAYPYGAGYEPNRCNDEASGPQQVGEFATCEGGYPGVFDMSGNVGEWDNGCTDFNSPDVLQNCLSRGGSWYQVMDELRCDTYRDIPRWSMGDGVGIRCCSDVSG
jgi:formylglycine-generating enzyme required for sulfatase activity